MYIQNMWIGKKKYTLTKIETSESVNNRIMQSYYGKLDNKGHEKKIATIEYHKPVFLKGEKG